MTADIEEKIRTLEECVIRIRTCEGGEQYAAFGGRIIECIRKKDYCEAGFVLESFKVATTQFPIRIDFIALADYIDATKAVMNELPQDEVARGRRGFYEK